MNPELAEIDIEQDEWATRSAYWNSKANSELPKRKRREKAKSGIILTGQGLSIRVDKGRLIVKGGFTYFPQKPFEKSYFKGSLDIPPRIVLIDGSGSITLDALDWLAEQGVNLIRLKWNGEFASLVTSGGQAADPARLAWQMHARQDPAEQVAFYLPLMVEKFTNTIETLKDHLPDTPARDRAIEKTRLYLHRLETDPPSSLQSLIGIEAQVASLYFATWRTLEIKWRTSQRNPIPDEWRSFYSRQSLAILNKGGMNYKATHPVNAMLNYVYALLLSRTQIPAIADGYDPMLGVVHTRKRSAFGPTRPGFAIDLMEPQRPVVDRVVLKLISEETFSGADFQLQSDGVVRVNPELVGMLGR